LVVLGFAGGLVPSPSAVVVLVGALALGRAWFGVALVAAYGVGMAVTLTGVGLLLVRLRARRVADRPGGRHARPGWLALAHRALPVVTASLIVATGLALALRGATQL